MCPHTHTPKPHFVHKQVHTISPSAPPPESLHTHKHTCISTHIHLSLPTHTLSSPLHPNPSFSTHPPTKIPVSPQAYTQTHIDLPHVSTYTHPYLPPQPRLTLSTHTHPTLHTYLTQSCFSLHTQTTVSLHTYPHIPPCVVYKEIYRYTHSFFYRHIHISNSTLTPQSLHTRTCKHTHTHLSLYTHTPVYLHIHTPDSPFTLQFSRSVMSECLRPHEPQHARPPCPSPTPGVYQNHVHFVGDAIQPSHPLLSPSPPALSLSQHQGLFK